MQSRLPPLARSIRAACPRTVRRRSIAQLGHGGLANPSQAKASQRDGELRHPQVFVEALDGLLQLQLASAHPFFATCRGWRGA